MMSIIMMMMAVRIMIMMMTMLIKPGERLLELPLGLLELLPQPLILLLRSSANNFYCDFYVAVPIVLISTSAAVPII